MWMLIALGIAGMSAACLNWSRGRGRERDLGVVSNFWLAEQRYSQSQDSRR